MKWSKETHRIVGALHRVAIGTGELKLFGYVNSNGAGWFNAWVTYDPDDYMGESNPRVMCGARTLKKAKGLIENELRQAVNAMVADLQ